jgi:hypothetical protein
MRNNSQRLQHKKTKSRRSVYYSYNHIITKRRPTTAYSINPNLVETRAFSIKIHFVDELPLTVFNNLAKNCSVEK